jgi:hypothetical protein
MNKISTLKFSGYIFSFIFFILLTLGSCSTHVEQDLKTKEPEAISKADKNTVTIAAIEKPTDEIYFDLIAKTYNCLGEDLWLGGKLESSDDVKLSKSGAISKTKVYKVTELTATGLSTNTSYLLNNNTKTLNAKFDEKGVIYLQLNEGKMQLKPYQSATPIVLAYQPNSKADQADEALGSWSCK